MGKKLNLGLLKWLFFITFIKDVFSMDNQLNQKIELTQEENEMNDVIENHKISWIEMLSTEEKDKLIAMVSQAIDHYGGITEEAILDITTKFPMINPEQAREAITWIYSKPNIHKRNDIIENVRNIHNEKNERNDIIENNKMKPIYGIIVQYLHNIDINNLKFTSKYFMKNMQNMWELRLRLNQGINFLENFEDLVYYDDYDEEIIGREHRLEFLFKSNILCDFPENRLRFKCKHDADVQITTENDVEETIKMMVSKNANTIKSYHVYAADRQNEWGNIILEANLFLEFTRDLEDLSQSQLSIFNGENCVRMVKNPRSVEFISAPYLSPVKIL